MKAIFNFTREARPFSIFKYRNRGFTLVELLVVVAIIGILAAFLMVNFVNIRQRGRDAQRKSDATQVRSALEIYRADSGSYPTTGFPPASCGDSFKSGDSSATYIQQFPCDPLSKTHYLYSMSSVRYCIRVCLENLSDAQRDSVSNPAITGCESLGVCTVDRWSYTVQNP